MLAVGEHLWGQVDAQVRRMVSALAGGVGCSLDEMCGALSSGALIIGSLYGRTGANEDDDECNRRVCAYRDRFLQTFGTTCCQEIRVSGYGSDGTVPCSALVEQAARLLLEVLAEWTETDF
jgi:C_GCAxxG_C_C family probable redox protein